MKNRWGLLLLSVVVALCLTPSLSMADASTDYSEMADWMKMTANQGSIPEGTTITMSNWQQYKQFMPLGMIKLFQGVYNWKMPQDVSMTVGPMTEGGVPSTWVAATEKYGPQTSFKILPNGHYLLENYHGGTPFPNPQDPQKGWKIMVNAYYAFVPALYVNAPENYATVWAIDKYGDVAPSTLILTYRWTDYITDANFPTKYDYSPGTWYAEWAMQETPEQARYTASLSMFYTDQEAHPFPDTFVFVPALRRSLRLSASSRCSPVFGFDWTYDDAKTNGFNGTTSIYTGDYLGNRKILTLAHFNTDGADLPAGYDMPAGVAEAVVGQVGSPPDDS
ncbi:DUF1329 domain-containing protein [bacterium]|nr:DUF1329 domain-containing protein [bacterium]